MKHSEYLSEIERLKNVIRDDKDRIPEAIEELIFLIVEWEASTKIEMHESRCHD